MSLLRIWGLVHGKESEMTQYPIPVVSVVLNSHVKDLKKTN